MELPQPGTPEWHALVREDVVEPGRAIIDPHHHLWPSGQVMADSINGVQFSGVGGHEDFVSGPGLTADGRSMVCLPSTSTVNGVLTSRILPTFPSGTVVSTPRHQMDLVITEWGVAELHGRTIRERALALAEVGHPDFRDELRERAKVWPSD